MKWPRLHLPRLRRPRWSALRPRSRRGAALWAAVLLALLWWLHRRPNDAPPAHWPRADILAAIRFVESSDRDDVPDGDDGRAIGPYQIHLVYWQDALRTDATLGGDYQQCRQRAYAERVIDAYMRHYVPDEWATGEAETIARIHNGGPKGRENPKTDRYWRRVRERLP